MFWSPVLVTCLAYGHLAVRGARVCFPCVRLSPDLDPPAAELPAGEQAELLPGHAEVESVLGVSLAGVENMEKSVRQILNNDTSAISTLRCLKLYLERLGCAFGDGQQLQRAAGGQGWVAGRGAASVGTALWVAHSSQLGSNRQAMLSRCETKLHKGMACSSCCCCLATTGDQVASCCWASAFCTGHAAAAGHSSA